MLTVPCGKCGHDALLHTTSENYPDDCEARYIEADSQGWKTVVGCGCKASYREVLLNKDWVKPSV